MRPPDEDLLLDRDGRILTVTLNRPKQRNAVSVTLAERLADEIERASGDEAIRVVVLRGAGPSFCAGYEVTAGHGTAAGTDAYGHREVAVDARHLRRLSRCWERIFRAPLPVIAQVHGHCLAGGTDLASHCDLVVAADDAVIGFPAVRSMGVALTQNWLYLVGPQWAKRLLLTGDTMTGRFAAHIGFALTSVPAADLDREVRTLAERLALVEREMLIGNKYVINHGLDLMGRAALQEMAVAQDAMAHQSAPAKAFAARARQEGLKAALAHRDGPFGAEPLDIA